MFRRVFWIVVGAVGALVGLKYLKKKSQLDPEKFSTEAVVELVIEKLLIVKEFVKELWDSHNHDDDIDEDDLQDIFVDQLASVKEPTPKPSGPSLN